MTEVIDPQRVEPSVGSLAEALDDVRRSAQQLLADVEYQPLALRIRAGDVHVELEWTRHPDAAPEAAAPGTTAPATGAPGSAMPSTTVAAVVAAPAASMAAVQGRTPTAVGEVTAAGEATNGLFDVCAPTVGTFYRAPEPGAAPFVAEGDQVRRGQQIGIVEAMKLLIPLEAEYDGQVVEVLVADGSPVEYGDRLFTFAPIAAG